MVRDKRKPATKKLQGKRILVVEDQPSVSEILAKLLRPYGYPSQANSAKEALEEIEHKAPDVILLDLSLPDMNGLEVARLVRRNEKTSRIPILAMSGSSMDYKKCFEMGCNDFIPKPFSISTLLARLSALLPGRSRSLTQDNRSRLAMLGSIVTLSENKNQHVCHRVQRLSSKFQGFECGQHLDFKFLVMLCTPCRRRQWHAYCGAR